MKNILYFISAAAICTGMFTACEDNLPESRDFPYETNLVSIKIVNAGADGNTVVEGTIDENKKEITFPKLDKDSPLQNSVWKPAYLRERSSPRRLSTTLWKKAWPAKQLSSASRTTRDIQTIS